MTLQMLKIEILALNYSQMGFPASDLAFFD